MRGVPMRTIQELMGASIEMTMCYAHLSPDITSEAVKVLDEPVPRKVGAHTGQMKAPENVTG